MDKNSRDKISRVAGAKKNGELNPKKQLIHIIKQSEELRNFIDKIPAAVIIADGKGMFQHINKAAQTLLYGLVELAEPAYWPQKIGLYLDDGVTPYPEHKLPVTLALQGQAKENEEMILRKEDDAEGIWISMSTQPLKKEDGSVNGITIFIQDISYRKDIELSRQKFTLRTEALYKLSQRLTDAGNNLKTLTQAVAKFISETIGDTSILTLMDKDDGRLKIVSFYDTNPVGHALMRKFVVQNNVIEEEHSMVGGVFKSGESLLFPFINPEQLKAITSPELKDYIDQVGSESIIIVPLTGRSGVLGTVSLSRHRGSRAYNMDDQNFLMEIAHRVALAIDNCFLFDSLRNEIAEKLSTKKQLDSSEERFRSIFESTTLGIKVLDLDGNILQTNPAFQRMVGYSNAELFGKHFSDFLHQEDVPQALKLVKELKDSGIPQYLFQHRAFHKDNSILWVKTTFSPVHTGEGNKKLAYIVGIVENINKQKRIELQMKELRDRLHSHVEQERLRLAQELHDNPMQSLYSVIYQIEELRSNTEPPINEEMKKVTSDIQLVIDSLRSTAQDLRPPTIFDFGLENAIRSYVEDFSKRHPHLKISLSLAQDRNFLSEETRLVLFRILQQALMNVVRHAEATKVKVRFAFDAEEALLEISDNGKGFEVPPDWIEFVRNGHYGLAGASERVDSLGGFMVVESKPGQRTTVRVSIPRRSVRDFQVRGRS